MRIICQKCNTRFQLPDDKLPEKPARFRCKRCNNEIVLLPNKSGMEVTGGALDGQPSQELPEEFGAFKVIQRIASGGMGDVFLATQGGAEGFERQVILKVLHQHLAREDRFVQAMVDEAKITVSMHHPNIVQMFDLQWVDKQLVLVMEYVPGRSLASIHRAYLRKGGSIPAKMAVFIAHQTLEGLNYAHGLLSQAGDPLGIVHRDISPQNILVTRDGWVKVIDFGIAKATRRLTHTRTGVVKGKFAYMAPEQFDGLVDRRADLFATGVVLWEMLASKRLFRAGSEAATMQRVMSLVPPPVSQVRPDAPGELDNILRRALEKNPAERYQTAREFRNDLTKVVQPDTMEDVRASVDINASHLGSEGQLLSENEWSGDSITPPSLSPGTNAEALDASHKATRAYDMLDSVDASSGRKWPVVALLTVFLAGLILIWISQQPDTPIDSTDGGVPDAGKNASIGIAPTPDAGAASSGSDAPPAADTHPSEDAKPPADKPRQVRVVRRKPVHLTKKIVQRQLAKHHRTLEACSHRHLLQDGYKQGVQLKLRFDISSQGAVQALSLVPSALESTRFGKCLRKQVIKIRFPAHKNRKVSFSIPLQFLVSGSGK